MESAPRVYKGDVCLHSSKCSATTFRTESPVYIVETPIDLKTDWRVSVNPHAFADRKWADCWRTNYARRCEAILSRR